MHVKTNRIPAAIKERVYRLLYRVAASSPKGLGMVMMSLAILSGCAVNETYISAPPQAGGPLIMRVASAQNDDPFEAGRQAALLLKDQMGQAAPHTVVLTECFEDKARKKQALKGVCTVFEKDIVFGFATYGSFTQRGCLDVDSIGLLGIAGDGIAAAAAITRNMGIAGLTMEENKDQLERRLRAAGSDLAGKLPRTPNDRILIVMADAHSPKNEFLLKGVQEVIGKEFPITGGSANKNAGQTYLYFRGRMYADSAIALLLSGEFDVSLAGRQAKENAKVISSAADGAAEALKNVKAKPFSVLAFNCAGRKGKLDNIADELEAIQNAIGKDLPLFGAYCAGEIGPADIAVEDPAALSSGVGWHVMFTVLAR